MHIESNESGYAGYVLVLESPTARRPDGNDTDGIPLTRCSEEERDICPGWEDPRNEWELKSEIA